MTCGAHVHIVPAVRPAVDEGESLSEFVEAATLQAARRRLAQDEFLARGRASLAGEALDRMGARIDKRMKEHRQGRRTSPAKA